MQISYHADIDLLYIRLDERKQEVINKRVSENVVLDIGKGDKIVGIGILDASRSLNLGSLLPVTYDVAAATLRADLTGLGDL